NPSVVRAAEGHFSCVTRTEATRLLTLLARQSTDSEADRLTSQLLKLQREGHWETTQGNAWALLALCKYFQQTEKETEPVSGSLSWGDNKTDFKLHSEHIFASSFTLDPALGTTPLKLSKTSGKTVFVQLIAESRLPDTKQSSQDHGFRLQRRYDRLNDDNQPERLESAKVGDRILVTLRLSVHQDASYVAVDDPLPSAFEAINPEFKTQQLS